MPRRLKIGMVCYPTFGGSGIVATNLGSALAKLGHQAHFIAYERPSRLNLAQRNIFFHHVPVYEYDLFKYPDYTLPLAVKMSQVHQEHGLDVLHVHYAVPHATAAVLAIDMMKSHRMKLPQIVTTLHGTDITLVGRAPALLPVVRYSMQRSCCVTAVSRYLKHETERIFKPANPSEVIYNFYSPGKPARSRRAVRAELGIANDENLAIHASNLRPVKRIVAAKPTIEGAGVHLRRAFGFGNTRDFDPFLLLDDFRNDVPEDLAGFPWHPHRGIETITYVLAGSVEHGDSMGNKGIISSGDVQWMTAGSGIIHQEMPQGDRRGQMWGFQLWANLPASHKMMNPRYREVKQSSIPLVKTAEAKAKMLEADAAYSEATTRIARVEQQLASVPKRITTQTKQLPNQYSAERLNTMMVELQNKRTQLLTKFRPDDRLVKEVDEQIRITREALARADQKTSVEEATDLNPLRQTLETDLARARLDQSGAKARRDTLATQLTQYEGSLKKLEADTAKHDDLEREKKEAEENYQLYAKKREEARIADELDRQKITNVSVAEIATAPQTPSSPNRPLNLILGIVLAAFLSIGCVFAAELLSDVVHTPRQLEALSGATVLATVPAKGRRLLKPRPREVIVREAQPVAELQN